MSSTRHHRALARITILFLFSILLSLTFQCEHVMSQDPSTLIISQYMEGSGWNKSVQILNLGDSTMDLSPYSIVIHYRSKNKNNGQVSIQSINIPAPSEIKSQNTFTICNSRQNNPELKCDLKSFALNFNGNDAVMLVKGAGDAAVVVDAIGNSAGDGLEEFSEGWQVCNIFEATENRTLKRKRNVKKGNGGDWSQGESRSEECEWEVEKVNVWDNDMSRAAAVPETIQEEDDDSDDEVVESDDSPDVLIFGSIFGAIGGVALVAAGVVHRRRRKSQKRETSITYQYYGRNANIVL